MKKTILILILIFSCRVYPQWVTLNTGTSQNLSAVQFLDSQTGFAAGASGTFIKTTNGGANWSSVSTGTSFELRAVYFLNTSTGLLCGYNGTILRTTNGGSNWFAIISGTSDHLLGLSFYNDQIGVTSGNSGTILYTTNTGLNWSIGQPTGYLVTFYSAYMINASIGFCAGVNTIFSPLVAKTTNGGANWVYSSFLLNNNEGTLRDIHFFDTQNGIAVSNLWNNQGAVSRTTNGGMNWTTQLYPLGLFGVDFPVPSIGYTVGLNGIIMKSTDSGLNWVQQPSGTAVFLTSVDFVDSVVGYTAGTAGVMLKTTNGGITAVKETGNNMPVTFNLHQNYPNPFNPFTKIKFEIPAVETTRRVVSTKIVIYDVLGREIAVLLNEQLSPGTYEVEWDGSDYSSGIYFYKIVTNDYIETKRMVLLK
jgi:photosystem II stability/assembly factor-like uncharacterized protein